MQDGDAVHAQREPIRERGGLDRRAFLGMSAAGLALAATSGVAGCASAHRLPGAGERAESLRTLAEKRGLLIGSAFSQDLLDDPRYGATVAREFNVLVGENNMKMDALQGTRGAFDFRGAESMMTFAAEHAMKVRAVPLVWHLALPSWVDGKTFPRQEALDILKEHIFTVMRHFRGRVFAWDVLNEGLNDAGPGLREESVWYRSIGEDYVEQVYHFAHEADPDARLFYNDYNMDGISAASDRCYAWAGKMLARGMPLHGIGLQYHTRIDRHPTPESAGENIRRFNDLGLSVHITELDVWVPAKATAEQFQQQAAVYRGVIETALAARDCPAVLLWGFTDRHSWVPGTSGGRFDHALIFDRDYRPKPAYEAIASALREA